MIFDKTDRMKSRDELAAMLRMAGAERVERYMLCPFHADKVKSAEVRQSPATQRWYFYCHTCGIADDVWALEERVTGVPVADLLRDAQRMGQGDISGQAPGAAPTPRVAPTPRPTPSEQPERPEPAYTGPIFATIEELIESYRRRNPKMVIDEVNPYTNPGTRQPDLYTIRYRDDLDAKKKFIQATPVDGGWAPRGYSGEAKMPLFNRLGLDRHPEARVLLVEGEKAVRAVTELGMDNLVTVTSAGGSKAARRADWSALAGRTVYVWADADEPGRIYAQEVIGYLKALNPPAIVYRVREDELELDESGDVVDYINENPDDPQSAIELVLFDAEPLGAAKSLADHFGRIARGEYQLVEFIGKPHLTNGTQAFLPGTVTIVAGDPEAGKSWLVLEEAWRQHEAGVPVRIMMLEDDHAFHLRRALAQMSGQADILDHRYTEKHIAWAQQLFAEYEPRLSSFGAVLEAGGSKERTLLEVADWVEQAAAAGARLIVVDPVTAASTSERSWNDDRKFMMRVKFAMEKYGASALLVTHPKLGKAGAPGLSGLAGGASYGRFSQSVLWLKKHDELQVGSIHDGFMTREEEYVRTLHIHKARNGRDGDKKTSRTLVVRLNPQNLCFKELGMLM
jgi:5S rRNA maturation endonuclease (ribonuclease M5)